MFSGEDYDQWALDDIIILSEKQKQVIPIVNPTLPQVCLTSEHQDAEGWHSGSEKQQ